MNNQTSLRASASATRSPLRAAAHAGFTLIELLVVIAIIAILAAMLLPALGRAKVQGQIKRAMLEMGQIKGAIHEYEAAYSRFPVSTYTMSAAAAAPGGGDFTFGAAFSVPGAAPVDVSTIAGTNNAEVMAILLDLENYGNGLPTVNKDHVRNPQRTKFFNANFVTITNTSGVGPDGVYRDPWGNPYVITLDLNNDDKARDNFYRTVTVSSSTGASSSPTGFNGLYNNSPPNDTFECNSPVMVWSAGPDRMIDPRVNANTGANKDNILSWKQ